MVAFKLKYIPLALIQLTLLKYGLYNLVTIATILILVSKLYLAKRSTPIYLVDFACFKPADRLKRPLEGIMKMSQQSGLFTQDTMNFQKRIMERSGLGEETCVPPGPGAQPPRLNMEAARVEAELVMFGALESLFKKTRFAPEDIGILIMNCSLFSPNLSLTSIIVNRYKIKPDILTYNLAGMGCSAGLVSIDLAQTLLKCHPNGPIRTRS